MLLTTVNKISFGLCISMVLRLYYQLSSFTRIEVCAMQSSIEDIPSLLADAWGITEASAQVLLSIVVILSVLLPVMILARGKNALTIYLIIAFLAECLLVGIGWLPFWVLIATVAIMAVAIALLGTRVVVGGD